jgi:hypothetical protein
MNNKKVMTALKKKIKQNFTELVNLQEEILQPRQMISASLIERYLGTKEHKRTSPAFYLSFSQNGKTKLQYVPKNKLKTMRTQAVEWKRYQQALRQWRQLSRRIWQDFKQLGKLQDQLGLK